MAMDLPANVNNPVQQVEKTTSEIKGLPKDFRLPLGEVLKGETSETEKVVTETQSEISPLKNQIQFDQTMRGFNFDFPENDVTPNNFQKAMTEKFYNILAQAKTSVSDVVPDINTIRNVEQKKYYETKKVIEDLQKKYPNDESIKHIFQMWNYVDNVTSKIPNKEVSKSEKEKVLKDIFDAYKVMGIALVGAKDGILKNDINAQNKLSQAIIYSGNFVFNAIYLAFGNDLHKQGIIFPSLDMSDIEPAKLDMSPDMFRYLNQTRDGGNDIQGVLPLNTYNWIAVVYNLEDAISKENDTVKKTKLIDLKTLAKNSQTLSVRLQQALINGGLEIAPLYYPNYFFSTPQDFEKYTNSKANQTIKRADLVDPANYGELGFLEGLYIDEHNYLIQKWLKVNEGILPANIKIQLQNQLKFNDKVSQTILQIDKNSTRISGNYLDKANNIANFPKLLADLNMGKLDINNKEFIQFLKNLESNLLIIKYINIENNNIYKAIGIDIYLKTYNSTTPTISNFQKTLDAFNKWKKANPELAKKI